MVVTNVNTETNTSQESRPQALAEPFKFIAHLLDLALMELGVPDGQESGTFQLEIESVLSGNICTIDTRDFRVCLEEFMGQWEVYRVLPMCPLCPDWDARSPIGNGFFSTSCFFNGIPCCETCYTIHALTHPVKVGNSLLKQEVNA